MKWALSGTTCMALSLALACAAMDTAGSTTAIPSLSLRLSGRDIALPNAAAESLSMKVRDMMSGCGINSVESPGFFSTPAQAQWNRLLSGSRLYIHFAQPIVNTSWSGRRLPLAEVLIGFGNDRLVGPELGRHGGVIAQFIKCGGYEALEIMCSPALVPSLNEVQEHHCAWYRDQQRRGQAPNPP